MVSSARSAGTYAGAENRALLARQGAVIAYLRSAAEERSGREDGLPSGAFLTVRMSVPAKAAHYARRALAALRRDPAWTRLVRPGCYLAAALWCAWTWAGHMALSADSEAAGAGKGAALTGAAAVAWLGLFVLLLRTDPGTVDPYGALGRDRWTATTLSPATQRVPARGDAGRDVEAAAMLPTSASEAANAALARLFDDVDRETRACTTALGELASSPLISGATGQPQAGPNALNPSSYVSSRVCLACEALRPLRAEHADPCGRCYERFDHVSAKLGVPIARRNVLLFACLSAAEAVVAWAFVGAWWGYLGLAHSGSRPLDLLRPAYGGIGAGAGDFDFHIGASQRAWILLAGSTWALFAFAALTLWSAVSSSRALLSIARNAAANLTAFERERLFDQHAPGLLSGALSPATLLHFVSVGVAPQTGGGGSGGVPAGVGGIELVPGRVNPFDSGSAWRNALDFFGASSSSTAQGPSESASGGSDGPAAAADVTGRAAAFAPVFARQAQEIHRVADAFARGISAQMAASAAAAPAHPAAGGCGTGGSPCGTGGCSDQGQAAIASPSPTPNMAAAARARAVQVRASLASSPQAWAAFEGRYLQQRAQSHPSLGASLWARIRGAASAILPHGHSHAGGGSHGHSH